MADGTDEPEQRFSDSRFGLNFRYPARMPSGAPIELTEGESAEAPRVHLQAAGGRELYFEVTRYPRLLATQHFAEWRQRSQRQRDNLAISDLEPTWCAGRKARRFRLYQGKKEREVVLIEHGDDLYRLIYDPAQPINESILKSVTFA